MGIVMTNTRLSPASRHFRALLLAASVLGGATPALAQEADKASTVDELVVTGARVSEASVAIGTDHATATVSITREALLSAPAGVTGLKMLESLPGFNVQANDALGMYEFGNSVSVRAFNFQQIGFLLDNIPMGRSDQFGGSPIYRYVDNENLLRVTASAGAGDVALPSYASLGPIVDYFTQKPSETAGGSASFTLGSDALKRGFLRLESGKVGPLSGYVSGSWIKGDLWRGPGTIDRKHYEGKLRYDLPNGGDLSFQTVHNDYYDYDSPSITKAQYAGTAGDIFGRKGRSFAYLGAVPLSVPLGTPVIVPTASLPQTVAGIVYSNPNYANYYKFAVNKRKDHLYGLTLNTPVTEAIDLTTTAYYEDKGGYGVSPEDYATSKGNYDAEVAAGLTGLTAPKGLQYGRSGIDGTRKGITAKASWKFAFNKLEAGVWLEKDDYHRTQARYNTVNGDPDGAPLLNEPVHLQRDYVSTRDTTQFFLKDTLSLLDENLKLELGFKTLDVDYNIHGKRQIADYRTGRTPSIDANWKDDFLPQVGLVYSVNPRDQVFASYSENMALPRGADDIFSAASPSAPGPKPETSTNLELGYRANRSTFNASFVVYKTEFKNRLQQFNAVVPGSPTLESFYQNVGAVKASGAEFSGQWKPDLLGGKIYFNANLSYNKSKFQDDVLNYRSSATAAPITLPTKGKVVPDFPEWLFQGGVTVEPTDGVVFNVSARHIDDRYTNFLNSETAKGYTIVNAYLDLGDGFGAGPFEQIKARVNVDNIFDKDYLGTISTTVTTPASFRPGSHRTIQFTLSADF
ncbi:TonB-dependent receptor [Caulobacter sp. BK020]|uniref:TonB-dependent receptor n=1 Tax=Caulobacter sp. BK020 TaxID=2512117 RepID=UPI00105074CD|nr:TonB-dependent receptor [Caulobacter sp. BK020]